MGLPAQADVDILNANVLTALPLLIQFFTKSIDIRNFWITTQGIVTIITTIVGILSILVNLYLWNKIRYLLIAVAV